MRHNNTQIRCYFHFIMITRRYFCFTDSFFNFLIISECCWRHLTWLPKRGGEGRSWAASRSVTAQSAEVIHIEIWTLLTLIQGWSRISAAVNRWAVSHLSMPLRQSFTGGQHAQTDHTQFKPISQLRFNYDTTTIPRRIRLRRKWSKLRFAFDSTAIRLRDDDDEKLTCSFFARVESRRMEAGARNTS